MDSSATGLSLPPLALRRGSAAVVAARAWRITAFGSSTTEGIGASSPDAGFAAVMRREMLRRGPTQLRHGVVLSNRGIGGNNAGHLHDRLDAVIADRPDLVLFQTGSNDPLQEVPLDRFERLTRDDLDRLGRESDADIVLIDQQYCRALEECAAFPPFLSGLHRVAQEACIPVFPRYRLMQGWCDMPGQNRDSLSPDGLHMGDEGCALLGAALAGWLLGGLAIPHRNGSSEDGAGPLARSGAPG